MRMSDWFPKNISTYGGEIDYVFWLIFYIVGAGFVIGRRDPQFFCAGLAAETGPRSRPCDPGLV